MSDFEFSDADEYYDEDEEMDAQDEGATRSLKRVVR